MDGRDHRDSRCYNYFIKLTLFPTETQTKTRIPLLRCISRTRKMIATRYYMPNQKQNYSAMN